MLALLLTTHTTYAQRWELIPGSPTDVGSMACDANGNLWVTTFSSGSIYCYNGISRQQRYSSGVAGTINAIAGALNGDIYCGQIGLDSSDCSFMKSTDQGNTWTNVKYLTGSNTIITGILITGDASNHNVYFGTSSMGVYVPERDPCDNISWDQVNTGLSLDGGGSLVINSLACSVDGTTLYAATENGIYLSNSTNILWT
jgi:hypothetical protein